MKAKTIWIAFLAMAITSCQKDANILIPEMEEKMAVYAFLEDGQNISLKLEEVLPLFAKTRREPGPISGALVVISDGQINDTLMESSQIPGTYESTILGMAQAGKSYSLKVMHPGFPDCSAQCTLPEYLPPSVDLEYLSVSDPADEVDSVRRAGFRWLDKAGESNYYRYWGFANLTGNIQAGIGFADRNQSDEHYDGETMYTGLSIVEGNPGATNQSLEMVFELIAMDIHLAKYLRTLDAGNQAADNPFSEPVIMYSNVQGGFGVFGALIRKNYSFKVY